jgi:hypothetical protein
MIISMRPRMYPARGYVKLAARSDDE